MFSLLFVPGFTVSDQDYARRRLLPPEAPAHERNAPDAALVWYPGVLFPDARPVVTGALESTRTEVLKLLLVCLCGVLYKVRRRPPLPPPLLLLLSPPRSLIPLCPALPSRWRHLADTRGRALV